MKIIISPSKTKKISKLKGIEEYKNPLFPHITDKIINEISKMNETEIEKKFKLKKEQAEKLLKFYRNFENEGYGHALSTYIGIAYKSMNVNNFNENDLNFSQEYLVILSALYGALTPFSTLKEYRLDMTNSIFNNKSLYELWKKDINDYFKNEKCIINLASKEYSKILNLENMYNLEFYDKKDGKLKQISTNSKKMRGFTVNHIVKNRITDIEQLKNISLEEYKYNEKISDGKKYIYIKEI